MSKKSAAAAAKRRDHRYLMPIVEGGRTVGYKLAPGPHLRAAGARTLRLKRADGSWMSFDEARVFRDAEIARVRQGAQPAALTAPKTLYALWDAYEAHLDQLARDGDDEALAPKTRAFYASMVKPWLAWGGEELVAALDRETIEAEYKAQKRARGHSAAHAGLRALMAVLAFGFRRRWLDHNPATKLGLARPQGRLRLGSPAEMTALVEAAAVLDRRAVGDAIVAGLWTAQRLGDILACDLSLQLRGDVIVFGRTAEGDFSQAKTGHHQGATGQAQVKVLPPLAMRLGGRTSGLLAPRPSGKAYTGRLFNDHFREVRAEAMKAQPSLADFEFRDLRDTAVTRLHLAGVDLASIALWSGHSMKSIETMLQKHYLVASRDQAIRSGEQFEAWRQRAGIVW
jgi:hypothetical protein